MNRSSSFRRGPGAPVRRPAPRSEPRRRAPEAGQDLVETALIMPVFLLLLIGIIEFGFIIFSYNSVASVAREGARFGVIAGRSADEIEAYALSHAPGLTGVGTLTVDADGTTSETVIVEVTYIRPLLSGNFIGIGPDITLRAVSSMRRE